VILNIVLHVVVFDMCYLLGVMHMSEVVGQTPSLLPSALKAAADHLTPLPRITTHR